MHDMQSLSKKPRRLRKKNSKKRRKIYCNSYFWIELSFNRFALVFFILLPLIDFSLLSMSSTFRIFFQYRARREYVYEKEVVIVCQFVEYCALKLSCSCMLKRSNECRKFSSCQMSANYNETKRNDEKKKLQN